MPDLLVMFFATIAKKIVYKITKITLNIQIYLLKILRNFFAEEDPSGKKEKEKEKEVWVQVFFFLELSGLFSIFWTYSPVSFISPLSFC